MSGAGNTGKVIALVLAGARGDTDAVAEFAGVPTKALAPLAGTPMIMRVLNALQASERIDAIVLCGPNPSAVESCAQLQDCIKQDRVSWLPAADDLGDSVQAALAGIDLGSTVMITTADHALLDVTIIDYFLDKVSARQADVSVGLVEYDQIRSTYPDAKRTTLKFTEGEYCGCNLYALTGARARDIIPLWQRTQTHRKQPWRMALGLFGISALAKYACGRLSLEQTRQAALEATDIKLDFVNLPFPDAGIDVDTPEDLKLAEKILSRSDKLKRYP